MVSGSRMLARGRVGQLGRCEDPRQLEMPLDPRQPRQERREHEATYQTVLKMRRFGYSVQRAGGHHLVNGLRLTTRQLEQLARGLTIT